MPWKNGGGVTIEIAVSPDGAGLDDFDWRVSMARVESDGPFSSFAGIDRTLVLLEGKGLILHVEGRSPLGLTRVHEPVSFPADVATSAGLIDGPITDLNVMSRRGRIERDLRLLRIGGGETVETTTSPSLILALAGTVSFRAGGEAGRLAPRDGLLFDGPEAVSLRSGGGATGAGVDFRPV